LIWSDPLYRCINPRWAREPSSGEGARMFGGRFNPVGVAALYLSDTVMGAVNEANQSRPLQPSVIVEYRGMAGPIFDATKPGSMAGRDVDPGILADPTWRLAMKTRGRAPSQDFAEGLRTEGFAGLLVPSYAPNAAHGARNVVLWTWPDLRAVDDERRLAP
jgi:RES domain-containing protein